MRHVQTDGATKNVAVFFHPNGALYKVRAEARRLGGKPDRIVLERRERIGQWVLVREWRRGIPPFTSHSDVGAFTITSDGAAYLSFLINQIDDDGNEKAQEFEEDIPLLAPPYNPNAATYTYVCSATDDVARSQAQGAFAAAAQAQSEVKLARGSIRELDSELDGKALNAARQVGEEVLAKARGLIEAAINAVLARLWGKPGGQPAGTIMDRVFVDLTTRAAPLPNVIHQMAIEAVQAALKEKE